MKPSLPLLQRLIKQTLTAAPQRDPFLTSRDADYARLVGHLNPYYGLFYLIAQTLKPALCVELGSYRGDAAANLAAGNPAGRVITVDIHADDKAAQQMCKEAAARYPGLTYMNAWTWDAVRDIIPLGPISLLYVDAWHREDYIKLDWDLYGPLVAPGGLVIVDDVMDQPPSITGVVDFFNHLPGQKFLDAEVHAGVPMGFCIMPGEPGKHHAKVG